MCGKLARICGITYRLCNSFIESIARSYYFAFVYPAISYGIVIWGGCLVATARVKRLQRYQDNIVLNLFKKCYNCEDLNSLYQVVGLLRIVNIYKLRVGMIMYRMSFQNFLPRVYDSVIAEDIPPVQPTRNANHIRPIFPRTEAVRINFAHQYATIIMEWHSRKYKITAISVNF